MPASLIQLYGKTKHNKFLISGRPDMSLMKQIYIKHNNIALEYIDIKADGNVSFGNKLSFTVPKFGQYVNKMFLYVKLPQLSNNIPSGSTYLGWTNSVGHAMIDKIELLIGEFIFDTQDGLYMELMDEINIDNKNTGYNNLIGKHTSNVSLEKSGEIEQRLYVPLKFWFNENIQSALPLFQLFHHSLKINVYFKNFQDLVIYDGPTQPDPVDILDCKLGVEYIFIEEQEVNMILNNQPKTEFVIKQIQILNNKSILNQNDTTTISLKELNHPVTQLVLAFRELEADNNNDYFNFNKIQTLPNEQLLPLVKDIKLLINGNERYKQFNESFYRTVMPYVSHSTISNKFIYILPFSKDPENYLEYSGALNFSGIDDCSLIITMSDSINQCKPYIYCMNYNFIKIENGYISIMFNS